MKFSGSTESSSQSSNFSINKLSGTLIELRAIQRAHASRHHVSARVSRMWVVQWAIIGIEYPTASQSERTKTIIGPGHIMIYHLNRNTYPLVCFLILETK